MKLEELREKLSEFWGEYKKVKLGLVGLAFLIILIAAIIFEPLLVPFPEAGDRWSDITYWQDYPANAMPVWTNLFTTRKRVVTQIIEDFEITESERGPARFFDYEFEYEYDAGRPPRDLRLYFEGTGNPFISITVLRPDGKEIQLVRNRETRITADGARLSVDRLSRTEAYRWARDYEDEELYARVSRDTINPLGVVFSVAEKGITADPEPLKGTYTIKINAILRSAEENIENPRITISGGVSGFMGTDGYRRDLFTGLLLGVRWALLIGLLTAFVSVSIGVIYGTICAYFGGAADAILQRIFEVFLSIPMLPLLIVISAIFAPSIYLFILLMGILFWTGPVKTVRSIGLQIKTETFIEASKALGAGHIRLIFKHMLPLLIPFTFASMALLVPTAVVLEATVSLLGLGDATIVSWGQILNAAHTGGAVTNGYWWWVVPPGMMIAITGMTFAFIGFAMDKILHPKLKSR